MNSQAAYNVIGQCWLYAIWAIVQLLQATCDRETRQLWECWTSERRCCVQRRSHWSGFVTLSWSAFVCFIIAREIRDYWGRGPDITSGHFHIPPLDKPFPWVPVCSGVDGRECGSWCLAWKHHTETPWIISAASPHPCRRKEEIGHFQSTPPPLGI